MSIKLSGKGKTIENCPIGLKVCYPSCKFWRDGKCDFDRIIAKAKREVLDLWDGRRRSK